MLQDGAPSQELGAVGALLLMPLRCMSLFPWPAFHDSPATQSSSNPLL